MKKCQIEMEQDRMVAVEKNREEKEENVNKKSNERKGIALENAILFLLKLQKRKSKEAKQK